jgi:hypothetical protein
MLANDFFLLHPHGTCSKPQHAHQGTSADSSAINEACPVPDWTSAMANPICYLVSSTCGGWTAQFDHVGSSRHFQSRELAVEAARQAARMHWEMAGSETCVQIEEPGGAVVADVSFGRSCADQ